MKRILAVVAGAILFTISGDGPDFGHYIDWSAAALEHNLFVLRGDILSPAGVPYNLWSFEPGFFFAFGEQLTSGVLSSKEAAYLIGWAAAMVLWASAISVFRHQNDGHGDRDTFPLLAAIVAATFIGTHAGFYSHTYATEVFGMSLVAAIWAFGFWRRPWGTLDALAAGALIAMLFLVRPYLVVYAIPAACVGISDERGRFRLRAAGAAGRLLLLIPIVVAVVQYALVNRWMTGSPWQPAYAFGGNGFASFDLLHPEFTAVVAHPWHGLLAYHPLYAVAFVALLSRLWSDREHRLLWGTTLLAVLAHLWLQSAWYVWWLGSNTFGMRGMAPAAVPLMAALAAAVYRNPRVWMPPIVVACLWSFTLMLDGPSQYGTWRDLLHAQRWALAAMAAATVGFPLWWNIRLVSGLLSVLVIAYMATRLADVHDAGHAILMAVAVGTLLAMVLWMPSRVSAHGACVTATLVIFGSQAVQFALLAVSTERHLMSGAPPPRPFRYQTAAPIDELGDIYREYLMVAGFDDKKAQLRRFLEQESLSAPVLGAADRAIVTRIRTAFAADPLVAGVRMNITAAAGIVRLESNDTNREQRVRAVDLARQVPGVVRVDDYMR